MANAKAPSEPSNPPEIHKPSLFLFVLLAPAGFALIFAIIIIMQAKQFMAMVAPTPLEWTVPEQSDSIRQASVLKLNLWLDGQGSDSVFLTESDVQAWVDIIPSVDGKRYGATVGDSTFKLLSTQPVSQLKGRLDFLFHRLGKSGYLNAVIEGVPGKEDDKFGLIPLRATLDEVKIPIIALSKRGDLGVEDFWKEAGARSAELVKVIDTAFVSQGVMIGIRKPLEALH
jgi:hypothetical protein